MATGMLVTSIVDSGNLPNYITIPYLHWLTHQIDGEMSNSIFYVTDF